MVKFEILCGIPNDWIADIAGGLNTSIQVQPKSPDNLAGKFNWLKEELSDTADLAEEGVETARLLGDYISTATGSQRLFDSNWTDPAEL